MSTYVSAELRQLIASRAAHLCDGGPTDAANLAYACALCNRAKGSDIGSLAGDGEFTRFFNPRLDRWSDHFNLVGSRIEAKSAVGKATVRILDFNAPERLLERSALIQLGRYPTVGGTV